MMSVQLLEKYLNDDEAAAEYDVSPRTYKRWRREGKAPPSIMVGGKRKTHVDDIAARLEEQRQAARAADNAKRRAR